MNQIEAPVRFWTLSMTEFHWLEYHSLLSYKKDFIPKQLCESITNKSHLLG